MKLIATRKADQNRAAIDPWTAVHFSSGLAASLTGVGPVPAVLGAVAYEVFEHVFERHDAGKAFFRTSGPEVFANVAVDVAAFVVGHALGQRWNATAPQAPAR